MIQPTQENALKIADEFEALAGMTLSSDNTERLKNVGDLLFTKEDIYGTADQLSQIFREICVENNITEAYFNERYKQYAMNVLGKFPQSAANNRANTIKMLKHGDRLSWKKFLELTTLVLGLKIKNLTVVVQDVKDNSTQEFSSDNKENN